MAGYPHVVIVGAGIMGACMAYHLAVRHARVTLVDKAPAPAQGATGQSFAWITAAHNAAGAYFDLRQQAIADWRRLEDEIKGRLKVNWCGALTWLVSLTETERLVQNLYGLGAKVRGVDRREVQGLEPHLKFAPEYALYAENEGAVDAALATAQLINAAREAGADIRLNAEVKSLITESSRITGVVTTAGNIAADVVVLAAGTGANMLCGLLGIRLPVSSSPATLLRFGTPHSFVNRVVSCPAMEVRAASGTLLLAAEDYVDESAAHSPQAIAQRTMQTIKQQWRNADTIRLLDVTVGERPMPHDGLPIIGPLPSVSDLYITVMHAGVTLAPVVARLAAAEISTGREPALLSACRPQRFADSIE